MSQLQLLNIALNEKDIVYAPDWVARDMVEFFRPSILEPCKGDGVFLKYLPAAELLQGAISSRGMSPLIGCSAIHPILFSVSGLRTA